MANTEERKISNFILFFKRPFTAHIIANKTGISLALVYKYVRKLRRSGCIKQISTDHSNKHPRKIYTKVNLTAVENFNYVRRLNTINKIIKATKGWCYYYRDIAKTTGLNRTTISVYVKAMIKLDIIRRDPDTRQYRPAFVALAKTLAKTEFKDFENLTNHKSPVTSNGDCKEL